MLFAISVELDSHLKCLKFSQLLVIDPKYVTFVKRNIMKTDQSG